jgi:hypothetical protein
VPRHVARLVTRLVASLVVDYSTSRRLVVDYSASRRTTTSPPPRVRVPRHVARLVTRLVVPLVVNYSTSRRLVDDYFAYAARPGASAHRMARHVDRRQLLRAYGCLGTSRGSSLFVDYSASRRLITWLIVPLVIDYFAYAVHSGASARRAARHTAHRRLLRAPRLRLAATLALLQPRRASRLPVSWQHRLYFEYAARRRDVIFRSHRIDHSS